jgi:hypothetical protein
MSDYPRYLHTLYCDDVRMEVGGKMTFVGVYQSDLIVQHNGPVMLPKLCVVATAQTPKEQPFKKLSFKLYRDEEIIQALETGEGDLQNLSSLSEQNPTSAFQVYGAIITIMPFSVERDCVLRVRAETEGGILTSSALRVKLLAEEAQ